MTMHEIQAELNDISISLLGMTPVLYDATYPRTSAKLERLAYRLKDISVKELKCFEVIGEDKESDD